MGRDRTTKEILAERVVKGEHVPLYNPEAIRRMEASFHSWKSSTLDEKHTENWHVVPHTVLGSDIPRQLLYTPLSTMGLDYAESLGYPGTEPYTRGIHSGMYRGRPFTIRQLCGAGSAEHTNRRLRMLLDHGATGVSLLLDLPTIQMFDSDEPEARGQVGTVGVPIDCVHDMDMVFQDVDIERISVSLVTHYPRNTAILFPMYLAIAERRGIPWTSLTGSVQNDFIMETVVRSAPEYIPPRDDFRIQCDNIEFILENVPKWNFITINGYNLRESGTSGITEMAVAVANAIETLEVMRQRGYPVDRTGERLAFFWSCSSDFFEEIARLRAMRRLWYRIMKHRFGAGNPRAMWMRCHVQTSGISLTREEPMNNIIRAGYQALAAMLGGAQSLHVDSYDEAYSVPSEQASLLSLRTQQIIQAETGATEVVDPLGGSFYLEALTDEIEMRILDELDEIEKLGGLVTAVEKGWLHQKIANYIQREQRMIEDGEIKVVGRNYFRDASTDIPQIHIHEHDERLEQAIREKLGTIREQRSNQTVTDCLNTLKQSCESGQNVMACCLEAARAGATVGEMRRAFVEAFGQWQPPRYL